MEAAAGLSAEPVEDPRAWRGLPRPLGQRFRQAAGQAEPPRPADQAAAEPVALRVSNVVRAFGGVRAVDGASFEVRRGSLTGLIGPNGAGKSTMINLISGFDAPDSGVIEFDGKRIDGKPAHAVARLGLMRSFQTPREWGGLTVMDNMLLSAPVEGRDTVWRGLLTARRLRAAEDADRVRARELLDAVGLLKLKDEPAGNLSGGQKRLLEFARLAVATPRLVLLDEPQAGVNPVLRERMGDLILAMVEADITVLMVEHNLPFLERLCGHVIVMALGQTIASGSMAELRANRDVVDAPPCPAPRSSWSTSPPPAWRRSSRPPCGSTSSRSGGPASR